MTVTRSAEQYSEAASQKNESKFVLTEPNGICSGCSELNFAFQERSFANSENLFANAEEQLQIHDLQSNQRISLR